MPLQRSVATPKALLRTLLAAAMAVAGVYHFVNADFFVAMVPKVLPQPLFITWLTGVMELALAVGISVEKTRSVAGVALAAFYVAVFPANVNMYLHPAESGAGDVDPTLLLLRLPLQLVFIVWALWTTRPDRARSPAP